MQRPRLPVRARSPLKELGAAGRTSKGSAPSCSSSQLFAQQLPHLLTRKTHRQKRHTSTLLEDIFKKFLFYYNHSESILLFCPGKLSILSRHNFVRRPIGHYRE